MTLDDRSLDILVLGTAEWNSPIATNQHYVVRELAAGAQVTFTESLGLRRPKIVRADRVRMGKRLRAA
jgi:teichuronic acid biosynthesis glycosyltransferase TuaH